MRSEASHPSAAVRASACRPDLSSTPNNASADTSVCVQTDPPRGRTNSPRMVISSDRALVPPISRLLLSVGRAGPCAMAAYLPGRWWSWTARSHGTRLRWHLGFMEQTFDAVAKHRRRSRCRLSGDSHHRARADAGMSDVLSLRADHRAEKVLHTLDGQHKLVDDLCRIADAGQVSRRGESADRDQCRPARGTAPVIPAAEERRLAGLLAVHLRHHREGQGRHAPARRHPGRLRGLRRPGPRHRAR